MRRMIDRVATVALVLGLGAASAPARAKDERVVKAGDTRAALAGVVHLTDNDVRFHAKDGRVVLVDPVSAPASDVAAKAGTAAPDLILVTHPHSDHLQPEVIKAYVALNPKVVLAGPRDVVAEAQKAGLSQMKTLEAGQSYELAGVKLRAVPAYFVEGDSHPKARGWLGYVLSLNGRRYYITGDTQAIPEMADLKADVVMPLLFGCGGNHDNALKIAKLTHARVVVPVHHGDQVAVAKKYAESLPDDVGAAYSIGGDLTVVR